MNILEVSFLVSDVVIILGAVAFYHQGFLRFKKKVDILQTKMDSFQDNIYHLQTYQRHELKFELEDIRNQQERSQVTISKLGIDLESLSNNEMFVKESKYFNLLDMVYNLTLEKSKNTKPTDSVKNELVKIIQDTPQKKSTSTNKKGRPRKYDNEPTITFKDSPLTYSPPINHFSSVSTPIYQKAKKEAKKAEIEARLETGTGAGGETEFGLIRRKVKADIKRVIRTRELEQYFKEVTKLTYRGYVLKHGIEEFKSMKMKVYKRLYFQKFTKPKSAEQKLTEQKPLM
jgi:hypothetical protein